MSFDVSPRGTASPSPQASSPGRRRNMQAIRRSETKPEARLRSALHRAGLRFRKDHRLDLPGGRVRPDIVFTRARVAVFVDGCFWHACPEHGRAPTQNIAYWGPKLQRTIERDHNNTAVLHECGWTVIRIWEHVPLEEAAEQVEAAVRLAFRSAVESDGFSGALPLASSDEKRSDDSEIRCHQHSPG